MLDVPHILEAAFEAAILIGVLLYLCAWLGGHRLTNGKAFLLFAFWFVGALILNVISPVPLSLLLVAALGPSALRLIRRIGSLGPKPISNQINAGPKDPALPEQPRLP